MQGIESMKPPSPKELIILDYIRANNGMPASPAAVRNALNEHYDWRSQTRYAESIRQLEKKGWITQKKGRYWVNG